MRKTILQLMALGLMTGPMVWAQGVRLRAAVPSPLRNTAEPRMRSAAGAGSRPMAMVQATDVVFPHLATGGGWETMMLLVNIGAQAIDFTQDFYDDSGLPMVVRFRTIPENELVDTAAIEGYLPVGSSICVTFYDSTSATQSGWSMLSYDSTAGRIGGYAAFRLAADGITNEGLVPLSSTNDTLFMMPFDNTEGYTTALALANPVADRLNHVQLQALDRDGAPIGNYALDLFANGHAAYVLTDRMPALAGQAGTLVVQSNLSKLSAVGVRMNVTGGMTFTSIPIFSAAP